MEKLSLVLPEKPPYFPRQFGQCAVVGNSGDLLKTKFGKEIDGYSAVFRENGAPIQVLHPTCWTSRTMLSFVLYNPCLLYHFLFAVIAELYRLCGFKKYFSPS